MFLESLLLLVEKGESDRGDAKILATKVEPGEQRGHWEFIPPWPIICRV